MTVPVISRALEVTEDLPGLIGDPSGFLWWHEGEGCAGTGEAIRIEPGTGDGRFADAATELSEFFAGLDLDPEMVSSGRGPRAFGAFTFDPEIPGSVLVVPRVTFGVAEGKAWSTFIGEEFDVPRADIGPADEVRYAGSSVSEIDWLDSVARAVKLIEGTDLRKVVLARDIHIWSKIAFDVPAILARLAASFPQCYTFACDGFIGATPELLVSKIGTELRSLVLAGSAARGSGPEDDELGEALLVSAKDLDEHAPAVESVVDALEGVVEDLSVGRPRLLKLANVQHLATDVRARVSPATSVLELVDRLHPTAAVCGTPRGTAMEVIRSLEGLDRARYAGPVGWVDAKGDGEWGIALRCAEIDGTRGRLFAGGGIVAASEPEDELEETRLKFRAMMSALEGR